MNIPEWLEEPISIIIDMSLWDKFNLLGRIFISPILIIVLVVGLFPIAAFFITIHSLVWIFKKIFYKKSLKATPSNNRG